MKRVLILGSLTLTLIIGTTGCKSNPIKNITNKQNEKSQIAYYMDSLSGELKSHLTYNKVGRFIEITLPKEIKLDMDTEVYVGTYNDIYSATIVGDKLMYIGQSPEEGNPITDIHYIKSEKTIIKKEELTNVGEHYEFRYPIKDVSGISINPEQEGFIEITIEGNEFVMIIPNEVYNNSNTFELAVRKNIEIEI